LRSISESPAISAHRPFISLICRVTKSMKSKGVGSLKHH
jgi:hypothetical protein